MNFMKFYKIVNMIFLNKGKQLDKFKISNFIISITNFENNDIVFNDISNYKLHLEKFRNKNENENEIRNADARFRLKQNLETETSYKRKFSASLNI